MKSKLSEIADVQNGCHFKTSDYVKSGCKVVRVTNLNSNDFSDESCLFIDESKRSDYAKYALKARDITVSIVGSWPSLPLSVVGKVTVIPEHAEGGLLNQNAVRIRAKGGCTQDYLIYSLLSKEFSEYLIARAHGSASQAYVRIEDIRSYEIELPNIERQKQITALLSVIDEKIYVNEMMNLKLKELRNTLLPKLMTGEISHELEDEIRRKLGAIGYEI